MGESTGDMELISETRVPHEQRKREEHTWQEAERLAGTGPFQQEYGRAAPVRDPVTGRMEFGEVSPSLGMPGMTQMGQYGQQYLAGKILGGPDQGGPRFDVRDPRTGEIVRPGELNLGFAPWERPAGAGWLPNPYPGGDGSEPIRQHPWQYEHSQYGRPWNINEGYLDGDPTGEHDDRNDPTKGKNGGSSGGGTGEGPGIDDLIHMSVVPDPTIPPPDPTIPPPDPTIPVNYNVAASESAEGAEGDVPPGSDPRFYREPPAYGQTFDEYMAEEERDPSLGPAPTEGIGLDYLPEWERQAAESAGAISGLLQQGVSPTDVTAREVERIDAGRTAWPPYAGPGVSEFIPIDVPSDPLEARAYGGTSLDQGAHDFGLLRDYHARAIEPRIQAMQRARAEEENARQQQAAGAQAWGGRRDVMSDELAARYAEIESGIRGEAEQRALADARQAADYRHQAEMQRTALEFGGEQQRRQLQLQARTQEVQNQLAAEMEHMRQAKATGNAAAERESRERFEQARLDYQTAVSNQQADLEAARLSQVGGLGSREQQLAAAKAGADIGLMRQGMTFGTAAQMDQMAQRQYEALLRQQQMDKQSWMDALQGGAVGLGLTHSMLPGRDTQQWQAPQDNLSKWLGAGAGLLGAGMKFV